MKSRDTDFYVFTWFAAGIVVFLLACGLVGWWRSSIQAEVYRREGIEMSTWEVWMGGRRRERST